MWYHRCLPLEHYRCILFCHPLSRRASCWYIKTSSVCNLLREAERLCGHDQCTHGENVIRCNCESIHNAGQMSLPGLITAKQQSLTQRAVGSKSMLYASPIQQLFVSDVLSTQPSPHEHLYNFLHICASCYVMTFALMTYTRSAGNHQDTHVGSYNNLHMQMTSWSCILLS